MRRCASRLSRGPFEAAIAFAGVVTLIAYVVDPGTAQKSAVNATARELLPYWEALYGLAGVLILYGMMASSLRLEVAGLFVLTAAVAINAISVANFYGAQGFASIAVFVAIAAAALSRARFLLKAYRQATTWEE